MNEQQAVNAKQSRINLNNIYMKKRGDTKQLSIKQCKEMLSNKFHKLIDSHIINEQQQELVQNYSRALQKDQLKEQLIKKRLDHSFFNSYQYTQKKDNYFEAEFSKTLDQDGEIRNQLSKEMKRSINIKTNKLTPNFSVSRAKSKSKRYGQSPVSSQMLSKIRQNQSIIIPQLSQRQSIYSVQLDSIIEKANSINSSNRPIFRRNVVTSSQKQRMLELKDEDQKNEILDKIIKNDVNEYLKLKTIQHYQNPELRKKHYEGLKQQQLSNFDRYNMSFVNYMRKKTHNNIEKAIYNDKIRQKQTYIEKFQNFILSEVKFSDETKRRLEKIFKMIELEYKRPSRNRLFSERVSK